MHAYQLKRNMFVTVPATPETGPSFIGAVRNWFPGRRGQLVCVEHPNPMVMPRVSVWKAEELSPVMALV